MGSRVYYDRNGNVKGFSAPTHINMNHLFILAGLFILLWYTFFSPLIWYWLYKDIKKESEETGESFGSIFKQIVRAEWKETVIVLGLNMLLVVLIFIVLEFVAIMMWHNRHPYKLAPDDISLMYIFNPY